MTDSCVSSHEYCPTRASCTSEKSCECIPCKCSSQQSYTGSTSTSTSTSSGIHNPIRPQVKEFDYERAKTILKQPSTITGENLFDHLVEIIKRIIDERPENVIDYFEQFSRDVRKHKFRLVERLNGDPYKEPEFLEVARTILKSLKLPCEFKDDEGVEENLAFIGESEMTIYQSSNSSIAKIYRDLAHNENILQLLHFWGSCGLGFQIDEMFQLSWAVQKIQLDRSVENARFWGRIYGLKGSYYIVEATLTRTETEIRFDAMKARLLGKMIAFISRRDQVWSNDNIDADLIPGTTWQNYPIEELQKMKISATPIPQLKTEENFDMPAEPVGSGLNQKTYFVTTSLSGEWQELPIVTPRHIQASRRIKKYFTGNLEASLSSYPLFPGTEKHYLRAMISRITSGTYIAPNGYYRKMTRKELRLDSVEIADEREEESVPETEEEDSENDTLITRNFDYKPYPPDELTSPRTWVHVRSNILSQGRVRYIDKELAIRNLEKKAQSKMKYTNKFKEEGDEDYDVEDEDEIDEEELDQEKERPVIERGPHIFSLCSDDTNKEYVPSWTSRYSSLHNQIDEIIIMRSNLWPGAYTFSFEKFCDSIYLGWGFKYVARCVSLQNAPKIKDVDYADVDFETTDPSVEMENNWRHYHEKTGFSKMEEMSDISVEFDVDDEEDEEY